MCGGEDDQVRGNFLECSAQEPRLAQVSGVECCQKGRHVRPRKRLTSHTRYFPPSLMEVACEKAAVLSVDPNDESTLSAVHVIALACVRWRPSPTNTERHYRAHC